MALKRSTVSIDIHSVLAPLGDASGGPVLRVQIDEQLSSGTGVRQADRQAYDVRTLGAGATETIDLTTVSDQNGIALGAAEITVFGLIHNTTTNTAGMTMDDSPANPWLSFIKSSAGTDDGVLTVPPGGFVICGSMQDPAFAVSGTNKAFIITNLDGATAMSYTLFAIARSA